jgi:hypothetical protein
VPITSSSFDASTNSLELNTSKVTSIMILEQSSNNYQGGDTTKSIVTSSSSSNSTFFIRKSKETILFQTPIRHGLC